MKAAYILIAAIGVGPAPQPPVPPGVEIVEVNPVCDETHCKVTKAEWAGIHDTQGYLMGRINTLNAELRRARLEACPAGRST